MTIAKVVRRDLHRRQVLRVNFDTSSLLMMQFRGVLALSMFVRPRMRALMKLSARSNLNEYAVSFPDVPRPCGNSLAVYLCVICKHLRRAPSHLGAVGYIARPYRLHVSFTACMGFAQLHHIRHSGINFTKLES